MHSSSKYYVALALGLGCSCVQSQAIEAYDLLVYDVGPLVIRPSLQISSTYDSNIFFRKENEEDNVILNFIPSVNVFAGELDQSYIFLEYYLKGVQYLVDTEDPTPNSTLSTDDLNRIDHEVGLEFNYATAKFDIKGTSRAELTGGIQSGSVSVSRSAVDRLVQDHRISIAGEITPKIRGTLAFRYDNVDYEDDSTLLDRDGWRTTIGANYDAFARNVLIAEVYYAQRQSSANSGTQTGTELDAVGGYIGARGEFTPKLNGEVRIGYEVTDRDDDLDSPEGVVGEFELSYQFTPKNSLTLNYTRLNSLSVESGNSGFTQDSVNLNFVQQIGTTGKWIGNAQGQYLHRDYIAGAFDSRNDDYYVASLGLTYRINEWATTGINYRYTIFDSNIPQSTDYDVHRISLSATIGY